MTDNDTSPPPKITDAPAAIWLVYGDIERDCTHQECNRNGDVGWCDDKQFDSDVEYVRSDTIEAQAERIRVLREAIQNMLDASDTAHAEMVPKLVAQGITSIPISDLTAKAYETADALRAALEATK